MCRTETYIEVSFLGRVRRSGEQGMASTRGHSSGQISLDCFLEVLSGAERSPSFLFAPVAGLRPMRAGPAEHPRRLYGLRSKATRSYPASLLLWMITEGCSDAGTVLYDLVVLHPYIELLDFSNAEVLQVFRRFFQS